ncbi:MAG: sugar ABC transporter ATP-binding protein, partial [Pseudolysinimonas sp.]
YLYGHAEVDGNRVDIVARVDGRDHPNPGDKIMVTPTPAHIHAFDIESGVRLSKPVTAKAS